MQGSSELVSTPDAMRSRVSQAVVHPNALAGAPGPVHALRALRPGSPAELQVQEVELPPLTTGTVLVAVTAAGVNRSDTLACRGVIPCDFPRTLGRDFAGVVVDGPSELVGTRVWGTGGGGLGLSTDGTHATHVVVPQDGLAEIPHGLTDVDAAASALSYFAAHSALALAMGVDAADSTYGLDAGDTVIVTGAAGGVGGAAAALAHWRGARVVGVVLDATEVQAVEASPSAPHFTTLIASDAEDFTERLRAEVSGVRAAVDVVGGGMVSAILPTLALRGGICVLGGPPHLAQTSINTIDFYRNALRLVGLHTGLATSGDAALVLSALRGGFESGHLTPSGVSGTYPLADAPQAYVEVEQGVAGRPVLIPNPA